MHYSYVIYDYALVLLQKAIGSISLEAVVAVIARMRVGNETVFPFYVHFRSGQWILGAHSEVREQ